MSSDNDDIAALFPDPPCNRLLGFALLDHDSDRGWVKIGFEGRPEFLNPIGRVQGGILGAMLDNAMSAAVTLKSGGSLIPVSIDMNLSFIAAAEPGPLIGEGEVVRLGRSVGFVEAQISSPDDRLLVRSTGSVMLLPADRLP